MLRLFLIIILSIWLVIFIAHKILTHFELKYLEKEGIYNPVSVGEYDLNVYLCGNENGKHTLVGMSGQGVNTYSMGLKATVDRFASDNRIAIVDRAGYGLSDSTTVPQTVEQVVEDYRTALKKAGCKALYILIPHSIGGRYAEHATREWRCGNFHEAILLMRPFSGRNYCEAITKQVSCTLRFDVLR